MICGGGGESRNEGLLLVADVIHSSMLLARLQSRDVVRLRPRWAGSRLDSHCRPLDILELCTRRVGVRGRSRG